MYRDGYAVEQDNVQALMWMSLAAAQGQYDAGKKREALLGRMTEDEIARAEQLVRDWKPKAVSR